MSSFISLNRLEGEIGVWTMNGARDDLLDWLADNRCVAGDERWRWCKSEDKRWPGCCVELDEFQPPSEPFVVTEDELTLVRTSFGDDYDPDYRHYLAWLLTTVVATYAGTWRHSAGTPLDLYWPHQFFGATNP